MSLSLPEIARLAGLPETTARRYARQYADFLPSHSQGRVKKFKPECVRIMQHIKNLYDEGMSQEVVRDVLSKEYSRLVDTDHHEPPLLPQVQGEPTVKDLMTELARAMKPGADNLNFILARLDHLEKRMEAIEKLPWWKKVFK